MSSFVGSLRNGSESFAIANSSLLELYNPIAVIYAIGVSVFTDLTLIVLDDRYVGFEEWLYLL